MATMLQALEAEADEDEPLEDLSGNRIEPSRPAGRADSL